MKRTEVTYGQLDSVLRSFGFTCQVETKHGPARRYEHKESGALILLPAYPEEDRMLLHHLLTAQVTLDGFGVAEPAEFAAKLQESGANSPKKNGTRAISKPKAKKHFEPTQEK
jgi:hypothetical protein